MDPRPPVDIVDYRRQSAERFVSKKMGVSNV